MISILVLAAIAGTIVLLYASTSFKVMLILAPENRGEGAVKVTVDDLADTFAGSTCTLTGAPMSCPEVYIRTVLFSATVAVRLRVYNAGEPAAGDAFVIL